MTVPCEHISHVGDLHSIRFRFTIRTLACLFEICKPKEIDIFDHSSTLMYASKGLVSPDKYANKYQMYTVNFTMMGE